MLVSRGQEIPALGHTEQVKNKRKPTCVGAGYSGDSYCITCGELLAQGEYIPALGHKTQLWNEKAATCTTAGYSGDSYCNTCGMLVSQGQTIPALSHRTQWKNNGDGTHLQYCTVCGVELLEKACADGNGDSSCDTCGYTFAVVQTTYRKNTSMTTGESYLITMSNKAMQRDLSAVAIAVSGYGTYTVTSGEDLTHWNYEHGKLWCEVSGVRYYLYVDSNKQLGMTTQKTSAASWTVSGGRISTAVRTSNRNSKTTTYYLGVSGSSFDVSTRKSSLVLYEQNT